MGGSFGGGRVRVVDGGSTYINCRIDIFIDIQLRYGINMELEASEQVDEEDDVDGDDDGPASAGVSLLQL